MEVVVRERVAGLFGAWAGPAADRYRSFARSAFDGDPSLIDDLVRACEDASRYCRVLARRVTRAKQEINRVSYYVVGYAIALLAVLPPAFFAVVNLTSLVASVIGIALIAYVTGLMLSLRSVDLPAPPNRSTNVYPTTDGNVAPTGEIRVDADTLVRHRDAFLEAAEEVERTLSTLLKDINALDRSIGVGTEAWEFRRHHDRTAADVIDSSVTLSQMLRRIASTLEDNVARYKRADERSRDGVDDLGRAVRNG